MKLSEQVQKHVIDSPVSIHRRDITAKILKCSDISGDFLEIGGDQGDNTVILLDIAKSQNKTVHVIDPWTVIEHDFDDLPAHTDVYEEYFLKKVGGYDNVKAYKCGSTDEHGKKIIEGLDLCFAFLDGGYLDWPRATIVENPTRNSGAFRIATDRLIQDYRNVSRQFNGPGIISISNVEVAYPLMNWRTGARSFPERSGPIIDSIRNHIVDDVWQLVEVPWTYTNIFLVKDK